MSEYIAAFIEIGGSIKKELLESTDDFTGLIDCLHNDGAGAEYDNPDIIEEIRQAINDANEVGKIVCFFGRPNYGIFENIENFCREHNIDFNRHSDSNVEFEAENIYFRNSKELFYHSLSNGKHDMVLVDDILKFLPDDNADRTLQMVMDLKNIILQRPELLKPIKIV